MLIRTVALALALALPISGWAASPRDELLQLVPDDVGFCLVVEDLRGHATTFLGSPFWQQVRGTPFGAALLNSPELAKLAEVDRFLQQHLHISFAQIRDELLGDAVVFAYRPGPAGQPEGEHGLILLHARDPKLLAQFLSRLDAAQRDSGEVQELQVRQRRGRSYVRRVEAKGTNYRYQRGSLLVVSQQEAVLQGIIDRDSSGKAAPTLPGRFARLGADRALARLWVNPRVFEPELQQKAAAAEGSEAVLLRNLLGYWQALDSSGLTLRLDQDIHLTLHLRGDADRLPVAARRWFAGSGRSPEMAGRFPVNAMLAVAGRLDVPALLDVLSGFLDDSARQGLRGLIDSVIGPILGQELTQNLFPSLGPECGFCVVAPAGGGSDWFPHVLGAVRVRPGNGAIPADLGLLGTLDAFTLLLVREHNRQHGNKLRLRGMVQDGVAIKYLVHDTDFPPGLRPAYALKDGFLLFASCPEAIAHFNAAGQPIHEAPLLRLSLREIHKYLGTWRASLVKSSAAKNQVTENETNRQLDHLLGLLDRFDRIEVSPNTSAGEMSLTLRLKTAQSLKARMR